MTKAKKITSAVSGALARETLHDRRTELVRDMMAKESAALDAKTARLRALRLAKEAEDKTEEAPAPKARPAARMKRINAG